MKRLFGMSNVVLLVVLVSMGMSLGSSFNKDALKILCAVLTSAERILNKTGQHSVSLRKALYGTPDRALFSREGEVTVAGRCPGQTQREHFCTYYDRGKHGCFAESVAGAFFCTGTKGNSHFRNVRYQVGGKCLHRSDDMQGTDGDDVGALEEAVKKVRKALKEGSMRGRTLFYLGDGMGGNGCSGRNRNDACAGYYGAGKTRDTVPIPWLDAIKKVLSDLRKTPQKVSVPATPILDAHTTKEPEALESYEPSPQTNTTAEEHTEETHTLGTPSQTEHPEIPKSRIRRSATVPGPTATSTAPEDTSTNTEEPEILDPTAAPFPLSDGADILTPLGLFMAAASFF